MTDKQLPDINQIIKLLPHSYPMLLVDRVIDCADESLTAIKNVTYNEAFFQGHFPKQPIMPGVLILEAMGQACGLLLYSILNVTEVDDDKLFFVVGIEQAKFKKIVTPGDQLVLDVKLKRSKNYYFSFEAQAKVDDSITTQATINLMLNKQ